MKLSIITINYNNAEGLRKTLASVAAQTYADIEHIIVDGGSTDGSVEIIREYADNESMRLQGYKAMRQKKNGKADIPASTPYTLHHTPSAHVVRWISEPDKGIYNAMNKGIEIALGKRVVNSFNRSELVEDKNKGLEIALGKRVVNDDHTSSPNSLIASPNSLIASSPNRLSDYIQILNSGDILAADDVTERMMAALASYSEQCERSTGEAELQQSDLPTILYGNIIKFWPDGRRLKERANSNLNNTDSFLFFYRGTLNPDGTLFEHSMFEKYGFFNEEMRICSDWEWFVRAVVLGRETPIHIDVDTVLFDMTGISESDGKNRDIIQQERRGYLESILPKSVLADYDKYSFPITQYQRLKKYHLWGFVHLIERITFKFEKCYNKLIRR